MIVISLFMLFLLCSFIFVDSNNATIDLSTNVLDVNVSAMKPHDHDDKSRVHGNRHVNENGSGNRTEIERSNGQIISTVKMKFDLNFVDLTGKSKNNEHPHKGALDENGNSGYIYDKKALHTSKTALFPAFEITQEQAQCDLNDATMQLLTNKVHVDFDAHERAETQARNGGKPRAKILCMIYIVEKFHYRLPTIYQTWGKKCDGFVAASNISDPVFHTVNIPHEGPEEYDNMWQKV